MESKKTINDLLSAIAKDTETALSDELDHYSQPVHKFSHRYLKRKRHILSGSETMRTGFSPRKYVLIPLATFLIIFTCAMSLPQIRKPVIKFTTHVYKEMTEFIIRTDIPSHDNVKGKPAGISLDYIPDGFYLTDSKQTDHMTNAAYEDDAGDTFLFAVYSYNQSIGFSMDTENAEVTETTVQGYKAVIAQKDGYINIAVFDDANQRVWSLTGNNITQDIALKIIENAEIK